MWLKGRVSGTWSALSSGSREWPSVNVFARLALPQKSVCTRCPTRYRPWKWIVRAGLSAGKGPGLCRFGAGGWQRQPWRGHRDICPAARFLGGFVWGIWVLGEAKTSGGKVLHLGKRICTKNRSWGEGLMGIGEKPQRTFNFLRIEKTRHFPN